MENKKNKYDPDIENCSNCRFYYKSMNEYDARLIIERNPELNMKISDYKYGTKYCVRKKMFTKQTNTCESYFA